MALDICVYTILCKYTFHYIYIKHICISDLYRLTAGICLLKSFNRFMWPERGRKMDEKLDSWKLISILTLYSIVILYLHLVYCCIKRYKKHTYVDLTIITKKVKFQIDLCN